MTICSALMIVPKRAAHGDIPNPWLLRAPSKCLLGKRGEHVGDVPGLVSVHTASDIPQSPDPTIRRILHGLDVAYVLLWFPINLARGCWHWRTPGRFKCPESQEVCSPNDI